MANNDNRSSFERIILAGIGAVAVTAEKAKEVLDELVGKGELTVEQGKVLNEELKHEIKTKITNDVVKPVSEKAGLLVVDDIAKLSDEALQTLKQKIAEAEQQRKADCETDKM